MSCNRNKLTKFDHKSRQEKRKGNREGAAGICDYKQRRQENESECPIKIGGSDGRGSSAYRGNRDEDNQGEPNPGSNAGESA